LTAEGWVKGTNMGRAILFGFNLALCVWFAAARTAPTRAASPPPKQTFMVPMRDGVHLATDVRLPAGDGPWPVALVRTPYDKGPLDNNNLGSGEIWPAGQFAQNGIVLVVQDTRGRHASEGKALGLVDEGWGEHQDGFDTVSWIRQQPWCNGKVATFGSSYRGFNQLTLAGSGPEGIVGQIVTAGGSGIYQNFWFVGGTGVWPKNWEGPQGWLAIFDWPPDVLQQIKQHPRYDALWAAVDLANRTEQVRWPVTLIGGWYDWACRGTLAAFALLQDRGAIGPAAHPHLVMGPWTHNATGSSELPGFDRIAGEFRYPANSIYPRDAPTQMQWLRFWLTGQPANPANEPTVRYYVMGDVTDPKAPGNVWRTADRWPPPSQPLRLYFTSDGGLDSQSPATERTRQYDYDPLRPVPSLYDPNDGPVDQRRVEVWPDVLLFTTPPLTEPVEVSGRMTVHLAAATSARDADFTAKITDVYPDGRSMLINDGVGIVRGSYRNSVEKAEFLTPGQRYALDIDLGSTSLIFNRGHRIRIAISSSNYPSFDVNRNNGYPWPQDQNHPALVAHQTIFLGGADGSSILLPEVVSVAGQ
jgi:predicted acyl esterase